MHEAEHIARTHTRHGPNHALQCAVRLNLLSIMFHKSGHFYLKTVSVVIVPAMLTVHTHVHR